MICWISSSSLERRDRAVARLPRLALDGVQQRARRIQVQRVAELVALGRAGRFDAGRLLARVVAAVAALAERPQQIAERTVSQEVQRLVGHFELGRRRLVGPVATASLSALALGIEIGRR